MADVYIVVSIVGGVINDVSAFATEKKAVKYIEDEAKANGYHKVNENRWESKDEEDDMTLWKLSIQ